MNAREDKQDKIIEELIKAVAQITDIIKKHGNIHKLSHQRLLKLEEGEQYEENNSK